MRELVNTFEKGFRRSRTARDSMAPAMFCSIVLLGLVIVALNWSLIQPVMSMVGGLGGAVMLGTLFWVTNGKAEAKS